jgi:hypothetical protein
MGPDWFWGPPVLGDRIKEYSPKDKENRSKPINVPFSEHEILETSEYEVLLKRKIEELRNRPPSPKAKLPKTTLRLLREGNPNNDDKSAVAQSIILGAANVDFNIGKLFLMMMDPRNLGGLGLRTRVKDHGKDWVIDQWMGMSYYNAQKLRAKKILEVDQIRSEVESYDWNTKKYFAKGKTRASAESMKAVLYASLDIAEQLTTLKPILSKYKISAKTGISVQTVRLAFHGLIELGWLEVIDTSTRAWIYSFLPEEERKNQNPENLQEFKDPENIQELQVPGNLPGVISSTELVQAKGQVCVYSEGSFL